MSRIPWDKILNVPPFDLVKLLVTAAIILFVNKIQLVNDRLSALLIALPLTSLVAMVWMHYAGQSPQRLANHADDPQVGRGVFDEGFVKTFLRIVLECPLQLGSYGDVLDSAIDQCDL